MKKNNTIRLFFIFLTLIVLNIITYVYFNSTPQKSNNTQTNTLLFATKDTAQIKQIIISNNQTEIILDKENKQWTLNKKYAVDPRLSTALLILLHNIQVKRPVSKNAKDSVIQELINSGTHLKIYNKNSLMHHFVIRGNASKTLAYFMQAQLKQPYVVELPGYSDYVAALFEYDKNYWRERKLFDLSWAQIKKIDISYPKQPELNFDINAKNDYFVIPNINNLDTAKLVNFAQVFSQFETDQFIDRGENNAYDSLINTTPDFRLRIYTLENRKIELNLYDPLPNENKMIGTMPSDEQILIFDPRRISFLFYKKENFSKK